MYHMTIQVNVVMSSASDLDIQDLLNIQSSVYQDWSETMFDVATQNNSIANCFPHIQGEETKFNSPMDDVVFGPTLLHVDPLPL